MSSGLQDRINLIENPEPRVTCIIIIDVSSSMAGQPIAEANSGLRRFAQEIQKDELTALRADVAVIAFNQDHQVVQRFGETLDHDATVLNASGGTKMAPPINMALDMIEARKAQYREAGIPYYRPIVMLITDGHPDHDDPKDLERTAERIKTAEKEKRLTFFSIGTESASIVELRKLSNLPPRTLRGTNFTKLFEWLSNSITAISNSQMGDDVDLPNTDGWSIY